MPNENSGESLEPAATAVTANPEAGEPVSAGAEVAAQTEPSAGAPDVAAASGEFVPEPSTETFPIPSFNDGPQAPPFAGIELLDDVELDVKIELGRTEMYIEDVLRLGVGSVVELDRLAGDPVDVYVNERLVARGEVLILNDNFCVRVNDILNPLPELEAHR